MPRFIYPCAFALSVLLLFSNFQCEEDGEELPFLLRDWQTSWIDNSGHEPLATESPAPRSAFGIRLFANYSSTGTDTLFFNYTDGVYLIPIHPLRKIALFAEEGFDNGTPGEDISHRFRLRHNNGNSLEYIPLDQASRHFNYPIPSLEQGYRLDLLMIDPPSLPGTYRFSVKITFDSLATPLNRDTSFTLPTVLLQ